MGMVDSRNGDADTSRRTTITIPADHHDFLTQLADSKHVSLAWMIREAIRTYIDQQTPLFSSVARDSTRAQR
jgi:predicted transcriptional regulator